MPALITWHLRRYPLMQAQDIYKLIHQGVFGPGHAVASRTQARHALAAELEMLAAQSQEQRRGREKLLEPIEPKGTMVRVNLRPLLPGERGEASEAKREVEWLVRGLVQSARSVKGEPELMRRRLAVAVRWCRKNLPHQAAKLERLAFQAGDEGYPAFHHSPKYRRAYRPAYRVVLISCLKPRLALDIARK